MAMCPSHYTTSGEHTDCVPVGAGSVPVNSLSSNGFSITTTNPFQSRLFHFLGLQKDDFWSMTFLLHLLADLFM